EQVFHAHLASRIRNVLGVSNAFHKISSQFREGGVFNPALRTENRELIELPSLSIRPFLRIERFFSYRFGLLLASFEYAFLAAPNALVRVQAFQNELRRRDLLLGTVF